MYEKYIKRFLDIFISSIMIIILIPLYLIIGILIKIIDKNPILYVQKRTGKNKKTFNIYKFRTMKDDKTTKLGMILRNTSLDELPQLLNILKGDMSIIGPRPWIPDYYERFNEEQKNRNKVRPGLVGLAQVKGRNDLDIFDKINFDLYYVEHISFKEDIIIILESFKVIIKNEKISSEKAYIIKELNKLESFKYTNNK